MALHAGLLLLYLVAKVFFLFTSFALVKNDFLMLLMLLLCLGVVVVVAVVVDVQSLFHFALNFF